MNHKIKKVNVVGGGFAGVECAHAIAQQGIKVTLWEMRPVKQTPAHETEQLAEVVCSNSFGSDAEGSIGRLLKDEMRALGSVVLECAKATSVPAGNALAVDREAFAAQVSQCIEKHPNIDICREEFTDINPDEITVIATGPLTSSALANNLSQYLNRDSLYFYDSIAPIIDAESVDLNTAYFGNRYEPEGQDYLNCPLSEEQYFNFIKEVQAADKVPVHDFEELKCFEACMPIEILIDRGPQTLSFGAMKPVGLPNPKSDERPYAVLQLRKENEPTTMYNMVGFQTRMKWGEQKRIFRMIPGLQNAEFVRLGSMHRNTYIDSPGLINNNMSLKTHPNLFFAGQITGVEGYIESAAIGQWVGQYIAATIKESKLSCPPDDTAFGALIKYLCDGPLHGNFAPINMNFGLLPVLPPQIDGNGKVRKKVRKKERRALQIQRAQTSFDQWFKSYFSETAVQASIQENSEEK